MKKFLSIIICICILAFCLVGCGANITESAAEEYNRMIVVEDIKFESPYMGREAAYVLVDSETGVCYLYVIGEKRSGITVMVEADGEPLTWPGG
jgi:TRAP-type C4-dicarboxylate transport system permease small subunit